jgi:hypothetical protein
MIFYNSGNPQNNFVVKKNPDATVGVLNIEGFSVV